MLILKSGRSLQCWCVVKNVHALHPPVFMPFLSIFAQNLSSCLFNIHTHSHTYKHDAHDEMERQRKGSIHLRGGGLTIDKMSFDRPPSVSFAKHNPPSPFGPEFPSTSSSPVPTGVCCAFWIIFLVCFFPAQLGSQPLLHPLTAP